MAHKITKEMKWGDCPMWWVGHHDAQATQGEDKLIQDNRFNLVIHGGVEDAEASYSYDDFALVELEDKFYLLETSGCSCPSPTETWRTVASGSLADIKTWVLDGNHSVWEVPGRQLAEFVALIDEVSLSKYGKVDGR